MKPVRVGICGLGTVGSGTVNVLTRNLELVAARAGRSVEIVQIGARRDNPDCNSGDIAITRDIFEVAANPDVDILVELIGGYDVAKELVLKALANGKHVVTANKALIAEHGSEIFAAAKAHGRIVAYEAGVAGGIPAIKAVREGLAGNRINWLAGIINGTGNFILTEMLDKGASFEDVLKQAQELGYAEADPTFDVEGIDAAHKLTILAANAFGIPLQFERVYTEGISHITPEDIRYAIELGYRVKHLGIARQTATGIEMRVHPTLVPESNLLARVEGVMNSVLIDSDAVGQTLYYGAGAGSEATGSAVIADIIDIARLIEHPEVAVAPLGFADNLNNSPILPVEETTSACYLRIHVQDHPGVLTAVTNVLGCHEINIDALLQKEIRESDGCADIVILTHDTCESVINAAIIDLEKLDDIRQSVVRIRVDHLCDH